MMKLYQSADNSLFEFKRNNTLPTYILRPEKDYISDHILKDGHWEKHLIDEARPFIKSTSNILDIGANIGVWSVELSKIAHQGKIFAFEPQPETFKQMCSNLFINASSNVIPYRYALGTRGQSGSSLKMEINPDNNGASKIIDKKSTVSHGQVDVEVKSLSDFTFPKIDFIKMDVEGFELNVLKGGEGLILRDKPVIFFEAWDNNQKDIFKWFKKRGYSIRKTGEHDFYALHTNPVSRSSMLWIWIGIALSLVAVSAGVVLVCRKPKIRSEN